MKLWIYAIVLMLPSCRYRRRCCLMWPYGCQAGSRTGGRGSHGIICRRIGWSLVGFILGWVLNFIRPANLWVNVVTKGARVRLAGLAGRHVAHITPMVLIVGLGVDFVPGRRSRMRVLA